MFTSPLNSGGAGGGAAPVSLAGASEKQFQCSICNKQFKSQDVCRGHILSVHGANANGQVVDLKKSGGMPTKPAPAAPTTTTTMSQGQTTTAAATTAAGASSSVPPPRRGLQAADPSRAAAAAFPTMAQGGVIQTASSGGLGGDNDSAAPRYRREIQRRERRASDPLHRPENYVPDEIIAELLTVWDKFGQQRLGTAFRSSTSVEAAQVTKDSLDEDVPTYVSMHAPSSAAAAAGGEEQNPFAALVDGKSIPSTAEVAAAPLEELTKAADEAALAAAAATEKVGAATESASSASSPDAAATAAATPSTPSVDEAAKPEVKSAVKRQYPADFADFHVARSPAAAHLASSPSSSSPFLCPAVENPFITFPNLPVRPAILNPVAAARQREQGGGALSQAAKSAAAEAAAGDSGDMMMDGSGGMGSGGAGGGDGDDDAPISGKTGGVTALDATPSAFAAVMQATSPFSVTESGAPLDAAFGTISDAGTVVGMQQPEQQSAFAAAAMAASPFAVQPGSSPFAAPFAAADLAATSSPAAASVSSSSSSSGPFPTSGGGPFEPTVDLSALFGGPGADPFSVAPQTEAVFTCKVCGKNTFRSEHSMIAHCQSKHGITPELSEDGKKREAAAASKKGPRVLPDLPPYIPSPVDLMATAPYSTTRGANGAASSASTVAWSDVELAPHARIFSSMTLMGQLTSCSVGYIGSVSCLQLTVFVAKTESADEEEICVRCFGAQLVEQGAAALEVGCSVLVEGQLRMNPSFNQAANKYFANPVVVVASPGGLVQRL